MFVGGGSGFRKLVPMTGYGQHVVQIQLTAHAGELVARRFPAETAPPPLLPRGGVRVAWRIDDAGGCVQFGHRANAVERVEEPQGGTRRRALG